MRLWWCSNPAAQLRHTRKSEPSHKKTSFISHFGFYSVASGSIFRYFSCCVVNVIENHILERVSEILKAGRKVIVSLDSRLWSLFQTRNAKIELRICECLKKSTVSVRTCRMKIF